MRKRYDTPGIKVVGVDAQNILTDSQPEKIDLQIPDDAFDEDQEETGGSRH